MKIRKTLTSWLSTPLLLTIRNEENLEEKVNFPFSPGVVVFVTFFVFSLISLFGAVVGSFILNRAIPQNAREEELRSQIIGLNEVIDSIAEEMSEKEVFLKDFQDALGGETKKLRQSTNFFKMDTTNQNGFLKNNQPKQQGFNIQTDTIDIDYISPVDARIRGQFENGSSQPNGDENSAIQTNHFFAPIKGIVTKKYNPQQLHYGIDVVAGKEEPIKSIKNGTVILASWTDDTGHVIGVQHSDNIISVYKHCSFLNKKIGDRVDTGEVIAIMGNSGEYTTGPHLHFELWHQGTPLNPEDFIAF